MATADGMNGDPLHESAPKYKMTPIPEDMPQEAADFVETVRNAMAEDEAQEAIVGLLEQAKDIPTVAAMLCLDTIKEAGGSSLSPDLLYGDGVVSDYVMDIIFAVAQRHELPGFDGDEGRENYMAAMDIVDEQAAPIFDQGGGDQQSPQEAPDAATDPGLMDVEDF
jgi:hypothetical protein